MNIKPTADYVLVKQVQVEEKTNSGLVITTSEQKKTQIFEVLDMGNGVLADGTKVCMPVNIGDKVLLSHYHKDFITIECEDILLVRVSDIIAIVE